MLPSVADEVPRGHPEREDDALLLARLVADALKETVTQLRDDEEIRMYQFAATFQQGLAVFREEVEVRIARLEKMIVDLEPPAVVEHNANLLSKYPKVLDTPLLFTASFFVITILFIVQIISQPQPNPRAIDITNALLLQILEQNTFKFGGDNK